MRQIVVNEHHWQHDATIKEKVVEWMLHHNVYLIMFSALSGSCYGAIEVFNVCGVLFSSYFFCCWFIFLTL